MALTDEHIFDAIVPFYAERHIARIAELERELSEARKDAQIIRNQALEDAAKVCAQRAGVFHFESPHNFECNSLASAIRAMKKEQPNG